MQQCVFFIYFENQNRDIRSRNRNFAILVWKGKGNDYSLTIQHNIDKAARLHLSLESFYVHVYSTYVPGIGFYGIPGVSQFVCFSHH